MEINVFVDEELKSPVDEGWLVKLAEKVLAALDVVPTAEVGLVITTQKAIQELNRKYLGKDRPTDVMAFSMLPDEHTAPESEEFITPPDGILHLGEVVISYPQAVLQAEEHNHTVEKELTILVIHGILHLLGYDDEKPEPKKLMRAKEADILKFIEVSA